MFRVITITGDPSRGFVPPPARPLIGRAPPEPRPPRRAIIAAARAGFLSTPARPLIARRGAAAPEIRRAVIARVDRIPLVGAPPRPLAVRRPPALPLVRRAIITRQRAAQVALGPAEIIGAIVAYAQATPALAGSVNGIRWEQAREQVGAPYATLRAISTRWGRHSERGGIESVLVELKLTHRSANAAWSLANEWTRGPYGLDEAELPLADGSVLAFLRESAPLVLPPLDRPDSKGTQLRAAVVEYRAIIERP